MKTFELGQKVKFVRVEAATNQVVTGEGVIWANLIDLRHRTAYQVKEDEKLWNLEPHAIDGTEEENAAYVAHHARVTEFVKEFSEKNQKQVDEANAAIEAMHTEFFGAPLAL